MKIQGKFTKLLDGEYVYDIIFRANSMDQKKLIITCDTEQNGIDFVADFDKLLDKYTRECIHELKWGK